MDAAPATAYDERLRSYFERPRLQEAPDQQELMRARTPAARAIFAPVSTWKSRCFLMNFREKV